MYLIYEYVSSDSKNVPFIKAAKNVLKTLQIPFRILQDSNKEYSENAHFLPDGGYYGNIYNFSKFIFANIYNIALAARHNDTLLAVSEESYGNLMLSLNALESSIDLMDIMQQELGVKGINVTLKELKNYVTYLPNVLAGHIDVIKNNVKFHFGLSIDSIDSKNIESIPLIATSNALKNSVNKGFCACKYYSSRHFYCDQNNEYKNVNILLDTLGLKSLEAPFSSLSYTHILDRDKALSKSGEILYAGIDLGVDFLCVFSEDTFRVFDSAHKECARACGRDEIDIPLLNLAQILLVAFGKAEDAGFEAHSINPLRLFENNFKVS